MPDTELTKLLKKYQERYRTKKEFAAALGIDPTHLSRQLSGNAKYPLDIEHCLNLAALENESPSTILRAAGRAKIADLIDGLYGRYRPSDLTAAQRELISLSQRVEAADLAAVVRFLRRVAAPAGGAGHGGPPHRPSAGRAKRRSQKR